VADATSEIKRGFLGDQQNAAAARAFGSAELVGYRLRGVASELDAHRRTSSTFPSLHPDLSQYSLMLRGVCGVAATRI